MKRYRVFFGLAIFALSLFAAGGASAELSLNYESILEDSAEPFSERIYSYDFDVDASGTIHVIYSKPVNSGSRCEIVYAKGQNGTWQKQTLESDGKAGSISTHLAVDQATGTVHVSYIKSQQDPDTHLVHQTISNSVASAKTRVEAGGWHTRMQLDGQGEPIFVREGLTGLRLFLPLGSQLWSERAISLPAASHYRIANFLFDRDRDTYHLAYGNGVSEHNFMYARSSDGQSWTASTIDGSGRLVEHEFWTDLIVDGTGNPHAAMYRYNTDNVGTAALVGSLAGGSWQTVIADGGEALARAGMGPGLALDAAGNFHAVWDNSPDVPMDADGARGNIMYRFSTDGVNWDVRQALRGYSAEGACKVKIVGQKLYLLVLGDYVDAKLYFLQYSLPAASANLLEISTDTMFYQPGSPVRLHARVQGSGSGDWYLVAVHPWGYFYYLGPDFAWHQTADLNAVQPVLADFPLLALNAYFLEASAHLGAPFSTNGDFLLASVVTQPGAQLLSGSYLTTPYYYRLHIW